MHVLIAGASTRAAAESALRAGYMVTSLDAFGDLDHQPGVRVLSLPRDLGERFTAAAAARVSRDIQCDAVAYLSSFENHPSAVTTLAAERVLLGNPAQVLRRARDPVLVRSVLGTMAAPGHPDAAEPESASTDRWLLKPRASGGGHGVTWWRAGDPVPRGHYVQRYIEGTPGSIAFVAARGHAAPLGMSGQLVGDAAFGASAFRYCGSILAPAGDSQFEDDTRLFDRAAALATAVAREFSLTGVNGVDFVARDGVPVAIEINPRYSASMELAERAYGVSIFGAHARAYVAGELPDFDLARVRRRARAARGKAIVFARHDVVCGRTREWLDDPTVRDVPHPGERIRAGHPVCTVFAEGTTARACYAALVERAARIYETLDSWASVAA